MAASPRRYATHDLRRTNARYGTPWWASVVVEPRRKRRHYATLVAWVRAYLPRWDGRV